MEIPTSRLLLRPLDADDTDGYARLLADPAVHPFVVEDGPIAATDVPARIARKQAQWVEGSGATWALVLEGVFIGYVAIHGLGKPRVAISYGLTPEQQGQHYGREAVRAVLGRAVDLGFVQVEARTHYGNEASVRLLLASGFVEIDPSKDPPRRVFEWEAPE